MEDGPSGSEQATVDTGALGSPERRTRPGFTEKHPFLHEEVSCSPEYMSPNLDLSTRLVAMKQGIGIVVLQRLSWCLSIEKGFLSVSEVKRGVFRVP
jgi:hypothetical protein